MAKPSLDVAVVGGGIIGVMVALGLLRRGMRVTIYERAADWPDTGAAFAFTAVARQSLQRLDPRVLEALMRVGVKDTDLNSQFWDGFGPRTKEAAENPETGLMFESYDNLAFVACLRSQLLLEMVNELPDAGGVVHFKKQLVGFTDRLADGDDKVVLSFADGTTANTDVVLGCDGVHSSTRRSLLGDHPASKARYAHKTVYGAFLPLDGAAAAFGPSKAGRGSFHSGPGAHMVSYPLPMNNVYHMFLFVHDDNEWPFDRSSVVPSSRDEALKALEGWGPHIRELVALLPEQISKYAIFDMYDHPAPTYAKGRVCIAGDAAHASSPFHGSGTTMGAEDALVLAELLACVQSSPLEGRPRRLEAALRAYSEVRMSRSQWLVHSSREIGEMYEFRYAPAGRDKAKFKAEFETRTRKIWDYDVNAMVDQARKGYEKKLGEYS
ncbi:FAD/NAD(P)-binding domain-containing protein [Cryphonectria parasitica EP155]|uniref:FAD/NAD(P)-binding domain-containing protein n=1 Tax=Cryphonectria parasitica (strain ATCC 38755 / EP155) TaxID=660469 RepID=A0A9P4Y261_CRYP1|nr:FAD/NAD(P)-binding domain-containing protein [Cryphonectria parasitica EP155]KAF3765283.1 FAD/NAD(P)-binding domain-containing protein [Cryphonectria parasitica EP155]